MVRGPERDGFHTSAVTARIIALAQTTEAKILVVDDDELKLALLAGRLESCGLRARGVTDTFVIMLTVLETNCSAGSAGGAPLA